MIIVKLDKENNPVQILNDAPKLNVVSIPDLDEIFDEVEKHVELNCDYSALIGTDFNIIRKLLMSDDKDFRELGRCFISQIITDYDNLDEYGLPENALQVIEFVLLNPDSNSPF